MSNPTAPARADLRAGPTAQQALDRTLAAWNHAGRNWDPDAFAEVYADDAVFFGGQPWHSVGRAEIRTYFASYRNLIASGRLHLQDHHVFQLAADLILVQGYGVFDLVLTDGRRSRSVLRATLTLVRRDSGWKVLQHHCSTTPEAPPIGTAIDA